MPIRSHSPLNGGADTSLGQPLRQPIEMSAQSSFKRLQWFSFIAMVPETNPDTGCPGKGLLRGRPARRPRNRSVKTPGNPMGSNSCGASGPLWASLPCCSYKRGCGSCPKEWAKSLFPSRGPFIHGVPVVAAVILKPSVCLEFGPAYRRGLDLGSLGVIASPLPRGRGVQPREGSDVAALAATRQTSSVCGIYFSRLDRGPMGGRGECPAKQGGVVPARHYTLLSPFFCIRNTISGISDIKFLSRKISE